MSKKKKKKKVKLFRNHPRLRWIWIRIRLALKVVLVMMLGCIVVFGAVFYKKYGKDILAMQDEANKLVKESDSNTFMQKMTSIVYDCNGDVLPVFTSGTDFGYVTYEDIPKYAVDAMVATEDRDFYEHNGVDMSANIKAVYELIKNKGEVKRGGSTITQQLARNIYLTNAVTWQRKVEEIFIALALEDKYEKFEIMEFYLNNIYFANGYYGIEAASKGYFDCSVTKLDLSQIAFLCAIPNSPTRYDPVVNIKNTLSRRDRILDQMLEQGFITQDECDSAKAEEIKLNMAKKIDTDVPNSIVTYITYCSTRAIMQKQGFVFRNDFENDDDKTAYENSYNETYSACQQQLYTKGYRIYTSIDLKIQKKLQKAVDDNLSKFTDTKDDGIYDMQGAGVCIDNESGRIVAIVGGRSQKISGYGLNRAYQSYRQPGSAIKPILVYTPAFENGYTPDTKVVDEPIKNGPKNSGGSYAGTVTMRRAVEKSINTIAWKLYDELIPHNCLKHLVDMNFYKITYDDDYLPASLGGVTYGATPVEMASAYAAIENDGVFTTPTCILKVDDAYGHTMIDDNLERKVVYEENAARMMTDVMKGVLTNGTAAGHEINNMDCAGKTGTTNDKKDGWFVGYTPYYTTSVWCGCDNPKTIDDLWGSSYPLDIWYDFMTDVHEGLEYKEFTPYEIVSQDDNDSYGGGNHHKDDNNNDSDDDNDEDDSEDNTKAPDENSSKEPDKTKKPQKTDKPKDDASKKPGDKPGNPGKTDAPVSTPSVEPTNEPVTKEPQTQAPVTDEPADNDAKETPSVAPDTKEPQEEKPQQSSQPESSNEEGAVGEGE